MSFRFLDFLGAELTSLAHNPINTTLLAGLNTTSHLSQALQKHKLLCLGIPSVMSTWDRRHPTHMFEGFGVVRTPHWQQRL